MASPSAFAPSSADAEIDNRPLLLAMFSALKDLYEHVEARALADLGAEVVDALAMCQHDFLQLVARLRDDPTPHAHAAARGASPRAALPVGGASPLAQRLEPPRGSPPSSPNSQMLEQLSSLNMDQLQEAARYFSLAEPAEGLVARSRHEARYLQQAAVEGREAAARRFLVTLERMTKQAGVRQPDEWAAAALQEPPADEVSGRRRRLWPADDDGTSGEQDSTAGSIGRRSPAPGSTASLAPSGAEAAGGGVEAAPPREEGGEEEAALAEGGGEARREEDGRVATRRDANAPLPAWTSWGEEEAAHPPAARRRKKRAPPPASFLPSSLPSPPRAEAGGAEAGGEETSGAAGGGEAAEEAVALRRVPSGGECVLELSACGWSSRSFAAVVRGAEAEAGGGGGEAGGEESAGGNSPNGVSEGGGRREKLRSPERKTAAELLEITQARHARAEATRELRAAEEASRIEKKRSREAQVRERNQRLSVERKKALDEKMLRAEAAREANVTSKASRARLENQKVEEIAFINSINELHNATPKEQRKDAITQRMEEAAARRELQHERMVSANAARESAAVERHRLLLQQQHAKVRSSGPRADEAYLRWLDFTRTVSQRAAEKNAKHRSEVLERREVQQRAAQLEVESRKAALNQRMAEANARRLAHIELLLQQARIASERHAAVQQAREARRTAWCSEWERSESADNESGGDGAARRRHARGASARRKQTGRRRLASLPPPQRSTRDPPRPPLDPTGGRGGARGDVYSASGDENRSESSRSGASQSGGTPAVELEAGGPLSEHEEESERHDSPASPPRHFDEGGESPRERRCAESGADGPAIIIPPTIAALAVVEPAGAAEGGLRRPHTASNAVSPLRNLHEKAQAAEAAQQEAEREQLRRLRARAKKVRQRMAATAATVRLEQLEQLWSSSALIANSNGSSTQSSKRILRLINSLAQVAAQPQSDGAEATVIELVKLLENGRERELHAIRTHGGFEHLLALATAGTAADSGAITVAPRRSTQTGALRALLAACALPCNRTYLLLRNYTDRLAFQLLPSAVMAEATAGRTCPPDVLRPTDAPLLPLLKLLRLVIATAPPIEAGRRLQSDLVVVLRFSGGLGALQRYCASCSSTIALAMQHEALLLQYIALLHALLIPVRMDPTCTCAAPLCSFLEESGLGGIPGLLCSILYEASQPAAPSSYWPADEAPRPPAGPSVPVLRLCRCAVQLLVHIGSVPLDPPRSPPAPSLLARVLGSGELKVQTFHLAHLALQLCEDVDPHGAGIPAADDDAPLPSRQPAAGGVGGEMRALTHDVVMLLGLFCLRSRANCEVLRWRWGQHQLMLHRLCSLRFGYFIVPALREVLLPTLICGCMHDAVNLRVLAAKLSPSHLLRYLELAMASQQPSTPRTAGAAGDSCTPAALMSDPSELPVVCLDFSLAARLPPALWPEAFDFLSSVPEAPAAAEAELCDSGEGVVLEATALSVTSTDSTFFPPPLAALCTG
ncbi:hypothetical protein AB1Y20_004374 [Prymnesium parvum]|uniref:S phase cyclin A-associated protein in the endoplasmic reticulum N-terminal domain-containing protein n=1 Tax=Prymnesium parvum TaxID=97485 RepID=A0AB34IYP3_PRYPA